MLKSQHVLVDNQTDSVPTESEGSTKRHLIDDVLKSQHVLVDSQTDSVLTERSMWKYLKCEIHKDQGM
jgi:hypothetical protein